MHNRNRVMSLMFIFSMLLFNLIVAAQDIVTPGAPVNGTLEGEPHAYSLNATRGQLVVVSMESEFDNLVRIEQDGTEIASDDDSGGDLNALLAHVIQEDGTYDVIADSSFFDEAEGDYTLTVDIVDPPQIEMGGSVTVEPGSPDGALQLYAVVEAAAGDVINVWATNTAEDEDISLTLIGVDGAEIETDDDDGPGNNALIRRVVLPSDGLYLLKVDSGFFDEIIFQPVEITVEATEALFLSSEPQDLILGDGSDQKGTEVYTVEMEAGTTYRFVITVTPDDDEIVGINLVLLDTDKFFDPEVDVQHGVGLTWDYLATANGTVRLDVHPPFFSTDVNMMTYTIAMETLE